MQVVVKKKKNISYISREKYMKRIHRNEIVFDKISNYSNTAIFTSELYENIGKLWILIRRWVRRSVTFWSFLSICLWPSLDVDVFVRYGENDRTPESDAERSGHPTGFFTPETIKKPLCGFDRSENGSAPNPAFRKMGSSFLHKWTQMQSFLIF